MGTFRSHRSHNFSSSSSPPRTGSLRDGPSEMARSTASSIRAPNAVEETISLTQIPSASANQPRISIAGNKPLNWLAKFRRAVTSMARPKKPIAKAPTVWGSIRAIVFVSWLNVLLVFIPISVCYLCLSLDHLTHGIRKWAMNFALPDQHTLIFVFAFLAIIPLAKLLAFATDELSLRVGQTLAGLLNATLGNAVELIVSIIALAKCQLTIVQSSLVGSILSDILLVLGMCFFAGGLRFSEQGFGQSAVQLNSSLLTISVIAVLLPGAFHMALQGQPEYSELLTDYNILKTSHGIAIILLFIYASYLVFQLLSHKTLYDDDNEDVQPTKGYTGKNLFQLYRTGRNIEDGETMSSPSSAQDGEATTTLPHPADANPDVESGTHSTALVETEAPEQPLMSLTVCLLLLVVVAVLVAVTAEFLVDSIDGLASSGSINKEFVGIILLPIVSNAPEHATAVTVSVKDKLTLSLSVTVGASIQIALFVIPFVVTLGWIMNKPLTLLFDPLESIVLFLSVLTVNYIVQNGKSNWLEGMILICLYMILIVTFWYYPGTQGIFPSY
ncbi:Sodium/calcium exchanger protein-domain-containing protein [Suillus subaureus]|uniref:Sodium/calcium exchanger protein-domain-containing protein n=1 Tax=Suillus subaureus TaxID=48587 RepID=A0A9P7JEZ8_9AGAM|nr:Sodium/calcium exchanger protein-domain-containing protein [Suillus subaureus]KAG1819224.1 Sodium/calcium exchanger protein-domain-containing protein [Suillus subaureus]